MKQSFVTSGHHTGLQGFIKLTNWRVIVLYTRYLCHINRTKIGLVSIYVTTLGEREALRDFLPKARQTIQPLMSTGVCSQAKLNFSVKPNRKKTRQSKSIRLTLPCRLTNAKVYSNCHTPSSSFFSRETTSQ